VLKKFSALLLITFLLQSCVVHSNFPFVCFLKKCKGTSKIERRIALRIKKNKTSRTRKIALLNGLFSKKSYSNRSAFSLKNNKNKNLKRMNIPNGIFAKGSKSKSQKKMKIPNESSGFSNNTRGK
jgi:hypothetical protein